MSRRRRIVVTIAGLTALTLGVAVWIRCGPLPDGLFDRTGHVSTVVVDRHGEVLYEARSADGQRGEWLEAGRIPPLVAAATMAAEDRRFRSHVGVDPTAIARAAWHDLRAGAIVEGGSTISQQVAELLLTRLDGGVRRRGWVAQVREAVVALRLEHRLTKDEILALYLNLAPYGNQIVGVERAARAYFGSPAAGSPLPALTPAEAAFLAALPQQPTRFNPWRDAGAATGRQQYILRSMLDRGWLEPDVYETASRETLTLRRSRTGTIAPHFVERVLSEVPASAARVETTLDAVLQRTVRGILAAHREDLDAHGAHNVAVVVLDNRRAEWIAWEGSGDYFDTAHGGAIDGVVQPRQPGSALKPFAYAAGFERGMHPGVVLPDVPSRFPTAEPGILYSPRNYDGRFRGPLLARVALAGSENVPAVALAARVGVPEIARLLRRFGFSTLDQNAAHYGLGLTLGDAEVRLDELVAAYGALARGGVVIHPRRLRSVDGRAVERSPAERVVDGRTAFWLADVLSDAEARAYAFGRGGSLEFPFTVAVKTGTSQAYHDNWTIGYTADVTVGVWVGNFDREPLRASSGVTGAGPIFHDVMLAAVEHVRGSLPVGDDQPILTPPPTVRRETLCAVSGGRATDACLRRVTEWVPADASLDDCTWHHASDRGILTIWPEPYRHWARQEGLLMDSVVPAVSHVAAAADVSGVAAQPSTSALAIAAPLGGATYYIDPTLRREFQALGLRATGASSGTRLEWRVDGTPVGTVDTGGVLRWPLEPGHHVIEVRDSSGRTAATTIEVH